MFIALPDGSGVMHALRGHATAAPTEGDLDFTFPAKASYSFTLPVHNWLGAAQQFLVSWTGTPAAAHMRSARCVDVPGFSTREHKLSYFAYTAQVVDATVTFTNESTGECLTFKVRLQSEAPGVLDTVPLQAVLRQAVRHTVVLDNPLAGDKTPVHFDAAVCEHPCVRAVQVGDMSGKAEGVFQVEFRPLRLAGELPVMETAELILSSPQLGQYRYSLALTTLPAGKEAGLNFSSSLGGAEHGSVQFQHFSLQAAKYSVAVQPDTGAFVLPAFVEVPAAQVSMGEALGLPSLQPAVIAVPVTFEPLHIGGEDATITLLSPDGMRYECELHGVGRPPQPVGPVNVPVGGSTISFKNALLEAHDFRVRTDGPMFTTGVHELSLAGKASASIPVTFSGPSAASAANDTYTGKVVVQCVSLASLQPWVFYVMHDPAAIDTEAGASARPGSKDARSRNKGKGTK
jgi:hypothetical protein